MLRKLLLHIIPALFLVACRPTGDKTKAVAKAEADTVVKYAKRFGLTRRDNFYIVSIFGNRHNRDTTSVFIVGKDTTGLHSRFRKATVVKSPCKKIAALSSIYASMFYLLGDQNRLVAIDNIDYVVNPEIIAKFNRGELRQLATTPQVDVEQTVVLAPDIIFTYGMGEGEKDVDKKLSETNIPLAISVDHLEENPLARAEWLKFMAVFTGKLAMADSVFDSVEKNYNRLKSLAAEIKSRPSVFSEIKYSEFWYMPGGNSYVARLMKDAGANYLWSDNNDFGSLPLSFEQVYAKAGQADFWINLSTLRTKKELQASESRYASFKAFKDGNLYNNTRHVNKNGYSDYWETGMIFPDRILSDLINIFHPELGPSVKNDLYYYELIK